MTPASKLQADKTIVTATLETLFRRGDTIEFRIFNAARVGTISGYFDSFELLVAAACVHGNKVGTPACYITLNPCNPTLKSRAFNRTKDRPKATTSDQDILERRLLLIDCDAVRPAGISASDEEHAAALERARQVRDALLRRGWPVPVFADSGNGGHLLYRLSLPNDDASRDLLRDALKALAAEFDDDQVKIDKGVFNASRVTKLYGTPVRKGDHTAERPHRLSRWLEVPESSQEVLRELLEALAARVREQGPPHPSGSTRPRQSDFSVATWIAEHQLPARDPVAYRGGRKWVLEECPFDSSHKAPDSAIFEQSNGAAGFKCLHNSCADNDWQKLRERIEGPRRPARAKQPTGHRPRQGASKEAPIPDPAPQSTATGEVDLLCFLQQDWGNAQRLIALYGSDLRYCSSQKKWLVWDQCRWAEDECGRARALAKDAMLEFLRQAMQRANEAAIKFARASLDSGPVHAGLSMAEPELAILPAALDRDPWLLNFRNGTVDLRTGKLQPHCREDLITKLVDYYYVPGAACPRWLALLDWAMGGGPDASEGALEAAERMVAYLQRALGYSLTGVTSERVVFMVFGSGDNGKSVILSTFRDLIIEYAKTINIETLMTRTETSNTLADLADLRGARFVQTSEPEENQYLSQGRLKRITQGFGTIKAARKYENPIEFPETHKLWLDTNPLPKLRDVEDQASLKRVHPIEFKVKVAPDQMDLELQQKLKVEAEGILAWAVEGARQWYEGRLRKPREIDQAMAAWCEENDRIGAFLDDRCVLDSQVKVPLSLLYSEYRHWCEDQGEYVMTNRSLSKKLRKRGFLIEHKRCGVVCLGLGRKIDQPGMAL